MIFFILGGLLVAWCAFIGIACCVAAGRADRIIEQHTRDLPRT